MKTGVGIGAGMVNVLEKAVNKAARSKNGQEALDKANTAIGQAKAGGLARRGPR